MKFLTKGRCFWILICFAEGTQVWTEQGLKAIEDIHPGEMVWSCDENTGEVVLSEVLTTSATDNQPIWDLVVLREDGSLDTVSGTAEHPFYVAGKGWQSLCELRFGDELVQPDGETTLVWEVVPTDRIETVYNLTVSGTHTYFVGSDGVMVHNKCSGHTAAAATGQMKHALFKQVARGRGWSTGGIRDPRTGRYVYPDAVTRNGRPIELKPNTPSGRRAGAAQLRRYEEILGRRGRVIYY